MFSMLSPLIGEYAIKKKKSSNPISRTIKKYSIAVGARDSFSENRLSPLAMLFNASHPQHGADYKLLVGEQLEHYHRREIVGQALSLKVGQRQREFVIFVRTGYLDTPPTLSFCRLPQTRI